MAFKVATSTGGDYLDLKELAADGPVLAVFRIKSFMPAELDNYKRNTYPVVADVFVVDGPRAGEVHLNETIKFAPSNTLRGVSAKASDEGAQPVNEVGDEIASRIEIVNGKGQPFVGLNVPSSADLAVIGKAYEAAGAEELWEKAGAAQAEREPVGATSGGAKRPW